MPKPPNPYKGEESESLLLDVTMRLKEKAWQEGCDSAYEAGIRDTIARIETNTTEFRPKPSGVDYYRIFVDAWNEVKKDLGANDPPSGG